MKILEPNVGTRNIGYATGFAVYVTLALASLAIAYGLKRSRSAPIEGAVTGPII